MTKRNFIIMSIKKVKQELLQNTKIDKFLFGQDLSETLKTAKAINESGADFQVVIVPKVTPKKKNLLKTKNRENIVNQRLRANTQRKETRSQWEPSSRGSYPQYHNGVVSSLLNYAASLAIYINT